MVGSGPVGGLGIDLVDTRRLIVALRRTAEFASTVFTPGELRRAAGCRDPALRLGESFAAKEAFLKAVGIGLWSGVPLTQIELTHGDSGRPGLRLGPLAESALSESGCRSTVLGLSRERSLAIAVVWIQ